MRILLTEDHPSLGDSIRHGLTKAGFTVDWARNAADSEELRRLCSYDLCLLDLGLPDADGLDLLDRWRRDANGTPVLVLTARGGLNDKVAGLDAGADDYLVKPFAIEELLARCRALLRRPADRSPDRIILGALEIDPLRHEVSVKGQPLVLSRREAQLLSALAARAGRVVTRDRLETALYGGDEAVSPNALEVAASRLRSALTNAEAGVIVVAVRGVGYMLKEDPS
jgi:two-component system OmpR family response regulator